MPELCPEDSIYMECFTACDSQIRAGFGGAYALDWETVIRYAESRRIPTDDTFFAYLRIFEHVFISEHAAHSEGDK